MRGATVSEYELPMVLQISIHTPHAGSDVYQACVLFCHWYFNPHSPCGERRATAWCKGAGTDFNPHSPCGERQILIINDARCGKFQSTLPMRGATWRERYKSL